MHMYTHCMHRYTFALLNSTATRARGRRSEVTLVCTDVEGSTAMWEWNSGAMQEAIFLHDSILRKLIPEHSGIEVMTEGDAFIMAFHDPADAFQYCLHAQARPLL